MDQEITTKKEPCYIIVGGYARTFDLEDAKLDFEFGNEITKRLRDGWSLHGQLFINETGYCRQAMTKYV